MLLQIFCSTYVHCCRYSILYTCPAAGILFHICVLLQIFCPTHVCCCRYSMLYTRLAADILLYILLLLRIFCSSLALCCRCSFLHTCAAVDIPFLTLMLLQCFSVFRMIFRTDSGYFPIQYHLTGFYHPDGVRSHRSKN